MSVVDVLAASDGRRDDPAVLTPRRRMTFQALDALVSERTGVLAEEGVEPGTLRPLRVTASMESAVELLALWRAGAVPVPLNAALTEREDAEARGRLAGATVPGGTQVVLWTSGTSGRPRGVALSWRNLEVSARAAARRLSLTPRDVWVASLSPAHVGGLALLTRSLLLGGAFAVPGTRDVPTLSRWLDGDEGTEPDDGASWPRPTHLSLVPTQLHRLLDHRGSRRAPASLRCVLVGGAHAPAGLVRRAVASGWPIALTYGATEMSSQIATAPPDQVRSTLEGSGVAGSVGRPLDGVELQVEETGELLARGPTRALGYVAGDGASLADVEGWFHTGDLGRVDAEGRLWITGRRMDRIVSGGVTVDAVEVEEALRAHPAVVDACVVGVPDAEWGERVAAWIVPVHGELDVEELDAHARSRLAPAKRPRLWRVGVDLPRNANEKVDRLRVRDAFDAQPE